MRNSDPHPTTRTVDVTPIKSLSSGKFNHLLENKRLHGKIFLMAYFQAIIIYFVLKEMQRNLMLGIFLKRPTVPPSGRTEAMVDSKRQLNLKLL